MLAFYLKDTTSGLLHMCCGVLSYHTWPASINTPAWHADHKPSYLGHRCNYPNILPKSSSRETAFRSCLVVLWFEWYSYVCVYGMLVMQSAPEPCKAMNHGKLSHAMAPYRSCVVLHQVAINFYILPIPMIHKPSSFLLNDFIDCTALPISRRFTQSKCRNKWWQLRWKRC